MGIVAMVNLIFAEDACHLMQKIDLVGCRLPNTHSHRPSNIYRNCWMLTLQYLWEKGGRAGRPQNPAKSCTDPIRRGTLVTRTLVSLGLGSDVELHRAFMHKSLFQRQL